MKYKDKGVILTYIFLMIFIILKIILNSTYFDFIMSLIIFIISFMNFKDGFVRIRDKYGKIQTLFIAAIIYLMFYYLLGLLFSFEYSPYSRNLISIINNFVFLILPIIFLEYARYLLINRSYSKKNDIFIIVIFTLLNMNINDNFWNIFIIFEQALLTFLARNCGFKALMTYILPLQISYILVPIFPKLDMILLNIINILYYLITYLLVSSEPLQLTKKRKNNSISYASSFLWMFIFIFILCFVLGVFTYRPLTIMSNSMSPTFSRGDIVLVKQKSVENLEVGDIIVYKMDKNRVVHRIVEKSECDNSLCFITKGDNNVGVDTKHVEETQVLGVVKFVIPKMGYPTVWLNELFN